MKNFMKKIFFVACLLAPALLSAQQPLKETLDPAIRVGKLENGLTYYLCHNNLPENRVEFYIAQRVGSILEEEHQRGLAHFLEHMAFNGTTHFPGKDIINYLENNGVKFGANLNAYTSIDETVYNISDVPAREGLIDSCLLILHDWASGILLEGDEIDAERKVIHEEWRTRNSANLRMLEAILPIIYPDSNRYAYRMPIGLMEVVDNFPHQAIRDYYHKWYRPDLQGIIVVGNIDVDKVEARIKELWKDVPAPVDAAVREYVQVPDNDAPIVAVVSDKEALSNSLRIAFKQPVDTTSKMTVEATRKDLVRSLVSMMFATRCSELSQLENPPFIMAAGSYGDYFYSPTRKAYTLVAIFKTGQWKQALEGLVSVTKQAYEFGFTQSELDRAVAEMESYVRKSYNERSTQKNSKFVDKALTHFLQQEPEFSEEYSYELYNQLLPGVTLKDVNETFRQFFPTDSKNMSLVLMSDENENSVIPTEEELLNTFFEDCKIAVEPYKDEHQERSLIPQMPEKGRIVKTTENKIFDATEYTLSNGAKVVIKTTDFKADEIQMYALSHGGTSLFDVKDRPNYYVMNSLVSLGGMGDFSTMELMKQLSGIQASVSAGVSSYAETVSGSSTIKDFETLLQLTYLRFTTTRVDSARYVAWKSRMANSLKLSESDPMRPISDTVSYLTYGNHERVRRFTQDDLDKVDYQRALDLFSSRVDNAADFVFIFIGNIDKEAAKPLIEQYIGALPSTGKHEKANGKVMPKERTGYRESIFDQKMETPKTMVYITYSGKEKYNLKNTIVMSMLSQVMRTVYTETIREEEGGTYGVSTSGSLSRTPKNSFSYVIAFDTNKEQASSLADRTIAELKKVAEEGPSTETFDNIRAYMQKEYESSIKENKYWASSLINYYMYGNDFYTDYLKTLNSVTPQDVQKMAKKVVTSKNLMKVIRYGIPEDSAE